MTEEDGCVFGEDEAVKRKCPVCTRKLQKRRGGYVCKNWRCPMFHKCGGGWVLSPSGMWFFQDTAAYKNMKYGVFPPHIDWHRLLLGAYALGRNL